MNYSDVEKKGFALAYNKKAAKKKVARVCDTLFRLIHYLQPQWTNFTRFHLELISTFCGIGSISGLAMIQTLFLHQLGLKKIPHSTIRSHYS